MITEWLRISAVHAMCRRSADALDFDPGRHFDCNADGVAIKMPPRPGPGDVIKMTRPPAGPRGGAF